MFSRHETRAALISATDWSSKINDNRIYRVRRLVVEVLPNARVYFGEYFGLYFGFG